VDKFIEYAPIIIVVIGFIISYKVFVTPVDMEKAFNIFEHRMENKFVLKETHNIAISEIKSDIQAINEKLDKIYDILIKG
jgi:hypothetical protein